MGLQPIESGHHGGENSGKKNGDLLDGMEIEIIGLMHLWAGGKVRAGSGGKHEQFTKKKGMIDKHGPEDHAEKKQVDKASETPLFVSSLFVSHGPGSPPEI